MNKTKETNVERFLKKELTNFTFYTISEAIKNNLFWGKCGQCYFIHKSSTELYAYGGHVSKTIADDKKSVGFNILTHIIDLKRPGFTSRDTVTIDEDNYIALRFNTDIAIDNAEPDEQRKLLHNSLKERGPLSYIIEAILKAKSLFNIEDWAEGDDIVYEETLEEKEERLRKTLEENKKRLKEAYENFTMLIQHKDTSSLLNKTKTIFINQLESFYKISISDLSNDVKFTSSFIEIKFSFNFSINNDEKYPDVGVYGRIPNLILTSDFDTVYNKLSTIFDKTFKKSEYTDDYVVIVKTL